MRIEEWLEVILSFCSTKKVNCFAHNFAGTGLSTLACISHFVAIVGCKSQS